MTEFRICTACGYARGFHVFFREEEGVIRIGLICPSCGQSYHPGWTTEGFQVEAPTPGLQYPSKEDLVE